MDPTPEDNTSQKENQKRGPISQGLDLISNIPKNPFGKFAGSRALAQTAIRGFAAFLAANPWVWGILGIVVLFVVVFVIVFSGFSGGIPGAPAPEAPIIAPTEIPTPTPAAP